jgi:hypothetical protein
LFALGLLFGSSSSSLADFGDILIELSAPRDATTGFGVSMAASEDMAVIGSGSIFDFSRFANAVHVFDVDRGDLVATLVPEGPMLPGFGSSMGIHGGKVIVGTVEPDFGVAYVFDAVTGNSCFSSNRGIERQGNILEAPWPFTAIWRSLELRMMRKRAIALAPLMSLISPQVSSSGSSSCDQTS